MRRILRTLLGLLDNFTLREQWKWLSLANKSLEHRGSQSPEGGGRRQQPGVTCDLPPAVAAAAKSLQSCPTLCDPIDGSPPGSPVLGILQARILEWVAISFSNA